MRFSLTEDGVPMAILREISLLKQLEKFDHPNIVRYMSFLARQIDRFSIRSLRIFFSKTPLSSSHHAIYKSQRFSTFDVSCNLESLSLKAKLAKSDDVASAKRYRNHHVTQFLGRA